jgi:Cu+-exporting ATPase
LFFVLLLMQTSKPNAQLIADRVAAWFVPIIVVVSLAIFGLWLALIYATSLIDTGGVHGAVYAMRFAITLLVVSCPCAVALSVPPVVVVGAGVAARNGLLVKDGRAFEQLQRITDIFFDKTGTITRGKPRVVALCTPKIAKLKRKMRKPLKYKVFALDEQPDGVREDAAARELLDLCASVEAGSEHPLARGIVLAAKEHLGEAWERRVTAEFRAIAGQGVECDVDGARAHVGTPQLLAEQALCDVGDTAAAEKAARTAIGDLSGELSLTIVYACVGRRLLGAIVLADMPRPESAAVVRWLTDKRGINVWMVTGDNASAAQCAARAVGIAPSNVVASVSPAGKAEHVRKLQSEGAVVCHVGDGVNDAVALTQADIGIAMSSSTDVASSAADVVLLKDGLRDIVVLVDVARAVVLRIRINLSWSFVYNLTAIPIAAGAFQPLSFVLPPALAGLAELLSSLPVIIVALLLYRYSAPRLDNMVDVV